MVDADGPGQECERVPVQRQIVDGEPLALGVGELDPGDAESVGKAAVQTGQADAAAGEGGRLGFDQVLAGSGVGADQEDGDEENDEAERAAEEVGQGLEDATQHQNVSPRPI